MQYKSWAVGQGCLVKSKIFADISGSSNEARALGCVIVEFYCTYMPEPKDYVDVGGKQAAVGISDIYPDREEDQRLAWPASSDN